MMGKSGVLLSLPFEVFIGTGCGKSSEKGPLREAISTVLKQSNSRASLRTQQIHDPQANDMGLKLKRCQYA